MAYFTLFCLVSHQYLLANAVGNSDLTAVDLSYECVHQTEASVSKAPLLLLHGLGGSKMNWNGIYETLAFRTGRRVCRADLRNQGDSPWNNETSVAAMTEDVIHLLDTIGEKTAVIIGHSLGGKVAIHTALNYPERITSIVVEDITPNRIDPEIWNNIVKYLRQMKGIMETIPEGSDESQANEIVLSHFQEFLKQFNMTEDEEALNEIYMALICDGGKCRWKANLDLFIHVIENDRDNFWTTSSGVFNSPVQFIYGKTSEFKVNEDEDNIRTLFPQAELVGIEGAGHSIHGFFPQFEDEVLKFLNKTN